MHDLAIITISTNEAHWLEPCLKTVFDHVGDITLDFVVADNESTDGTQELVETGFPEARVVRCRNRGFSHGNNRALLTTDSRYVLFLNPDTETIAGTYEDLVRFMDDHPTVGLIGVKQLTGDGALFPTVRRFPSAVRALAQAFGSERFGLKGSWAGERVLDLDRYDTVLPCDWTSGSFMFARREALESAGYMDERSFIYSEEPDLCLRMKKAGWDILHVPFFTIVHYGGKPRSNPRLEAQDVVSRRHYARKFFGPAHRLAYLTAIGIGYVIRLAVGDDQQKACARSALRVLVHLDGPPFGPPPTVAVAIREDPITTASTDTPEPIAPAAPA